MREIEIWAIPTIELVPVEVAIEHNRNIRRERQNMTYNLRFKIDIKDHIRSRR